MFCPFCGKEAGEATSFCAFCGKKLPVNTPKSEATRQLKEIAAEMAEEIAEESLRSENVSSVSYETVQNVQAPTQPAANPYESIPAQQTIAQPAHNPYESAPAQQTVAQPAHNPYESAPAQQTVAQPAQNPYTAPAQSAAPTAPAYTAPVQPTVPTQPAVPAANPYAAPVQPTAPVYGTPAQPTAPVYTAPVQQPVMPTVPAYSAPVQQPMMPAMPAMPRGGGVSLQLGAPAKAFGWVKWAVIIPSILAVIAAVLVLFVFKTDEQKITDRLNTFVAACNSGDIRGVIDCCDKATRTTYEMSLGLAEGLLGGLTGFDIPLGDMFEWGGLMMGDEMGINVSIEVLSIEIDESGTSALVEISMSDGDETSTDTIEMCKEDNDWYIDLSDVLKDSMGLDSLF